MRPRTGFRARSTELYLDVVPVILGGGERMLENVGDPMLEPVEVVVSPKVTHVRYRILHP